MLIVTVPVYNEAVRLEANVKKLHSFLRSLDLETLIILAEDGSSDGSFEIAKRLGQVFDNIRVLHNDCKMGRGRAIREAWLAVSGDVYVFVDADLAADLTCLPALLRLVRDEGYDFVTGSRYAPGANVSRPLLRRAVSIIYNALVRKTFSTGITDHQCGFKAFNKKAVKAVLRFTREDSWAWDTEVAVLLKRLDFKVGEIAINWNEVKYERTPISRLFKDIYLHGLALVRMYMRAPSFTKNTKLQ